MKANNIYREMVKAYAKGDNTKALELARSLIGAELNTSKTKDVQHIITVLGG